MPVPPSPVRLLPVLLSDDRIARIPAIECGEPLVDLAEHGISTPNQQFVREI
jgi:D-alanyl-D-alanine dipeptidase